MASMMSAFASMVTLTSGNNSLSSSTSYPWLLSSRTKCSACMVVYPQVSILWIRSASSIASKRHPMRDQFAIYCGLIPMIVVVGVSPPEVRVTASDRTSPSSSTTPITWRASPEPISSLWMVTIGLMSAMWSLSSQHPTTATDVETSPP